MSFYKTCSVSLYNILLTVFIPLFYLAISIFPIQYFARYVPADLYGVFVLLFSIGIAWFQCDDIIRSLLKNKEELITWTNLEGEKDGSKIMMTKIVCFLYKITSFFLSVISAHYALIIIRLSCPTNIPLKTIKMCFTQECVQLYLVSTACYYWFIACPVIAISLNTFSKFAKNVEDETNIKEDQIKILPENV
uniref:Uncharacterized protein n=1 Tax=Panagrolaimus sp. JU765 TaxID=591449 RepID=A0AC34Q3G2_9BILA